MNQSLDEIIKKNRGSKANRGSFRGRGGQQSSRGKAVAGRGSRGGQNVASRRGMVTKQGASQRGRITDARFKIIAKKRREIVDARDQLAQLAKQTDARDKLTLLRLTRKQAFGQGSDYKYVKTNDARSNIRNKQPRQGERPTRGQYNSYGRGSNRRGGMDRASFALKKSRVPFDQQDVDLQYEGEDDYMDLLTQHMRTLPQRTVQNTVLENPLARGTKGIPPLLRVKVSNPLQAADLGECYYDDEDDAMDVEPSLPMMRTLSTGPAPRAPQRSMPVKQGRPQYAGPSSNFPLLRQDWEQVQKTNIVVNNMVANREPEYSGGFRSKQLPPQSTNFGARIGFAQPPSPVGFKVVVSNLQNSVTEEDIKELFGDIGPLIQWRLVRPGTAEVTYKQKPHAVSAVEVYHKRQLDGQPMNVVFVSSASNNDARVPQTSKLGSKGSVQPDLGIIHKALFKI